jgi:hypothetical protein
VNKFIVQNAGNGITGFKFQNYSRVGDEFQNYSRVGVVH